MLYSYWPAPLFSQMQEYRGIAEDTRVSTNTANQAMIRRFNQHSTMVLRACSLLTASTSSAAAGETSSGVGANGSSKHQDNGRKSKQGSLSQVDGSPVLHTVASSSVSCEEPLRKKVSAGYFWHTSVSFSFKRYIKDSCRIDVV